MAAGPEINSTNISIRRVIQSLMFSKYPLMREDPNSLVDDSLSDQMNF